jgi:membrane protease subunit (stomatin/prohibitin family)
MGKRQAEQQAQQQAQYEQQQAQAQAPPPPAPAAGGDDLASKLTQLKGLLDQGVLTQAEFDQAKQKLLSS